MNIVDFTQLGGFRLKQSTFKRLQDNYLELLTAFMRHIECPAEGYFIIGGCEVQAGGITEGYLYINGHLCYYAGVSDNTNPSIAKVVTTESIVYKSGENLPVITIYSTTTGSGTPYNEFIRKSFTIPNNITYLRKGQRTIELLAAGSTAALAEDITFTALPSGTNYTVIGSFETPDGGVSGVAWSIPFKTLSQFNLSGTAFDNLANTQLVFKWRIIED